MHDEKRDSYKACIDASIGQSSLYTPPSQIDNNQQLDIKYSLVLVLSGLAIGGR